MKHGRNSPTKIINFKHVSNMFQTGFIWNLSEIYLKHVWNLLIYFKQVSNETCLKYLFETYLKSTDIFQTCFKWNLYEIYISNMFQINWIFQICFHTKLVWNIYLKIFEIYRYISNMFQMKPVWNIYFKHVSNQLIFSNITKAVVYNSIDHIGNTYD